MLLGANPWDYEQRVLGFSDSMVQGEPESRLLQPIGRSPAVPLLHHTHTHHAAGT